MFLDRQEPYRARHLVWPGASNQSGAGVGTHFAWHRCRGTYCGKVALPWRPHAYTPRIIRRHGAGGGISCAEGDSGPPRDVVKLAGRAPARLAVHCNLATGGPGAAMRHAPFGRPRRPLGTFPRGESTSSARRRTKPPTRNGFLVEGKGKELSCFSLFRRGFRLCGGDQRAFRSPFGNLRPLCCK